MSNAGYEKRDVNIKAVMIPLTLFGLLAAVFVVILDQYFAMATEKMYYKQVLKPESVELKQLRQKETDILNNYKLMDKEKGMYRIPIERAMELEVMEHAK